MHLSITVDFSCNFYYVRFRNLELQNVLGCGGRGESCVGWSGGEGRERYLQDFAIRDLDLNFEKLRGRGLEKKSNIVL